MGTKTLALRSLLALTALGGLLAGLLTGPPAVAAPAQGRALADSWSGPLSTRGRYIVDTNGDRFRLQSGNWGGAQGSWSGSGDINDPANHHSGEDSNGIPLGLDRASVPAILSGFHQLGLNSIRLPFSNQMIHTSTPVPDSAVAANPRLRGMTPLQVYDAVVAALTADGFAVVLNNHTNTTRWCCGIDGNERWNSSQSTRQWEDDWVTMASRYRTNHRVVGADLYNEVRRDVLDDPNWGLGDRHDWQAAAQEAGDRILTEADPDLLIIIEGINWTGIPADGLPHGRPTLTPVRTLSNTLVRSGKLVYSAHFYGFTGPNHSGATGLGETHDPRYQDLTRDQLQSALYQEAFYVEAESGQHFTAPVWISEFGIGADESAPSPRAWFTNFTDYLTAMDADFAYWPLVGWSGNGQGDSWALLRFDTSGTRSGILDSPDWRATDWNHLVTAPHLTGPVAATTAWHMLSLDHGDAVQSLRMRARPDWDSGARKATCPDGERLTGLSHTLGRGLCTDATAGDLRSPTDASYTVVRDERYVPPSGDWASGYTKLQCPQGQFLIGYSLRGATVSAALCAPARSSLGTAGRTVWFDRGDNLPGGHPGGDFAYGAYKGQCAPTEYTAGIAFTTRVGSQGTPDALLCRALS
ncbi:cellulase family glycosylhydrolase [Kitasatospora sp. GP82]|uniref:glycoside hydrolase family 5 protein n=1 Tax=Kitasatospora sp. GP82 TaxID=3035089 RepID=UPI00247655CD|nr:cellulase family glycosylhydrolase [Kitasatospora sp. GP82]MDH6126450.1 endoglucanase [Kitasatospora sp. GP82]